MPVLNDWVTYVDRSYEQIKASVIARVTTKVPEITDFSESNILVVIISMFAGIAEMLNYYIDSMAREAFLETARLYASGVKLVKMLDYRILAYTPASVDLTFTTLASSTPTAVAADYSVPAGIIVQTSNGVPFITTEELLIPAGEYEATVPSKQMEATSFNAGITNTDPDQTFTISVQYANGTMNITINSINWELVDTFAFSGPTSKHFLVDIDANGNQYIQFGDGTYGEIPPSGYSVLCTCYATLGSSGNSYQPGTITSIQTSLALPGGIDQITCTNDLASSGGADIDSLADIKKKAPLSVRTNWRAVTFQDYQDIPLLVGGVQYAYADGCCGRDVDLYIAPSGGGIASTALLNDVSDFMEIHKTIGKRVNEYKAGITNIFVSADVYGRFRYTAAQVHDAVVEELTTEYAFGKTGINVAIRSSDILALIDNLVEVDYVENFIFYAVPYARPTNHETELSWTREVLPGCDTKTSYVLTYTASGMNVSRNGSFIGTYSFGTVFNDFIVKFTLTPDVYAVGNKWEFTVYPYNENINLDDYTVPQIIEASLNLTSYPQSKSYTSKPAC